MEVHHIIEVIVPYLAAAIELVGIFIILYGSVAALFLFFRARLDFNNKDVKLELAQALALALEFKLAAEILKSVVVQTIDELILLAAIVALRVVMTLLIHWEIKSSEQEGEELRYRPETSSDTLSNVYARRAEEERTLRDRWQRRRAQGTGTMQTSSITSEGGKQAKLYTHTFDQGGDDTPAYLDPDLPYQSAPEPTREGSTFETHGVATFSPVDRMEGSHMIVPHLAHDAGEPKPDESLASLRVKPQRQVTREEDGLTVTIERQIQRMARRRRQVNQSPKDDVKNL